MASNAVLSDEESFIILGTSPTPSMEEKCNSVIVNELLDAQGVGGAVKNFSNEASMAFKAQFELGDGPSTTSMMLASTIVSEDTTIDELQKRFGEILDENVIMKETLKQNNESMKDQFLLLSSCQDDMLRTHNIHKEKFDETRALIERLRLENKKLKQELARHVGSPLISQTTRTNQSANKSGHQSGDKSGPSSVKEGQSAATSTIEFVTSPDDDTITNVTAQLELVEKERRLLIVENERLTWQKQSLEEILKITEKERDDLIKNLQAIKSHHSSKEAEFVTEINTLKNVVRELEKAQEDDIIVASSALMKDCDVAIQQSEAKAATLRGELKNAQLRILELESVKLEFARHKAASAETAKMYKEQLQELQGRLKEAQTVVFQPVSVSPPEPGAALPGRVRLYDRTLRHIAELLNSITGGTADNLASTLEAINTIQDLKLERASAEHARATLRHVKEQFESQHSAVLANVGQIKGTMSIFEGIFTDYKEVLKKSLSNQEQPSQSIRAEMAAVTSALLSRAEEAKAAKREVSELRLKLAALEDRATEAEVAKAQNEVYKADFEAEREARQMLASEKEHVLVDLRRAQRRSRELLDQLEEVRKLNPNLYKSATTKKPKPHAPVSRAPAAASTAATGNMVYTCPKCNSFSCDQYKVMEDHFDFCLDDF